MAIVMTPARISAMVASAYNIRAQKRINAGQLPSRIPFMQPQDASALSRLQRADLLAEYREYCASPRNNSLHTRDEVDLAIALNANAQKE